MDFNQSGKLEYCELHRIPDEGIMLAEVPAMLVLGVLGADQFVKAWRSSPVAEKVQGYTVSAGMFSVLAAQIYFSPCQRNFMWHRLTSAHFPDALNLMYEISPVPGILSAGAGFLGLALKCDSCAAKVHLCSLSLLAFSAAGVCIYHSSMGQVLMPD